MQSLKKCVLFVLMAVFVASVAVAPAHAQSTGVSVDVPFDFTVGSKHLTAGSYRIETAGAMQTFAALFSADGKVTYSLLYNRGRAEERNGEPYLVFARNGEESFLTKIIFPSGEAYDLPLTKRGQEVLANATTVEHITRSAGAGGSR